MSFRRGRRAFFGITLAILLCVAHFALTIEGALSSTVNPFGNGRSPAPKGRFPYACSLRKDSEQKHLCGGTLIHPRWVLTAAHCVDPNNPKSAGLRSTVFCGIYYTDEDDPNKKFSTVETYIHEKRKSIPNSPYDIALLKLDRDAKMEMPKLATQGTELDPGTLLAAIGWGRVGSSSPPKDLQVATDLAYTSKDMCQEACDFVGIQLGDDVICADFTDQAMCQGDSGGALFVADEPDDNLEKGKPVLDLIVGVMSFGPTNCASMLPGVYASISYFADWIADTIRSHDETNIAEDTQSLALELQDHAAREERESENKELLEVYRIIEEAYI